MFVSFSRSNSVQPVVFSFRSLSGYSLFVRVEVMLKGATFHVLFTDASQLPPPFRIDNLSEVSADVQLSATLKQNYSWVSSR